MSRGTGFEHTNAHIKGDNNGKKGLELDSFLRLWEIAAAATAAHGRTGSVNGKATGNVGIDAAMKVSCNAESIYVNHATSATSTDNMLPANAIILGVVTHPVGDLASATTYDVGDETTGTRFKTGAANNLVSEGPVVCLAHWAGTVAIVQASAAKLKITFNTTGTGYINAQVFYISFFGGLDRSDY